MMFRNKRVCAGIVALFLASAAHTALAAGGTATHAWVSASGANTTTCGGIASPCATFQYTLDNIVAPGGTITVVDSGSYGPAVISSAINIIAEGALAQIVAKSGDAIVVQAGAGDKVVLRGLTLLGSVPGGNGVNVISGGQVVIENCVITGFGNGVNASPSTGGVNFTVAHSSIVGNRSTGVYSGPTGSATVLGAVSESDVSYDSYGVYVYPQSASASAYVIVSDSTVNGNVDLGLGAAGTGGSFAVTRTTAIGNGTGAEVLNGSSGVGHAYTYGDNRILKSTQGGDTSNLTSVSGN